MLFLAEEAKLLRTQQSQKEVQAAAPEVMSSGMSSVHRLSRLHGLVVDTGCRMTGRSLKFPEAVPCSHLRLYPRNGVVSAEASAGAELTP